MRRFFLGMAIASLTAGAPLTAFGGDREIADAIITAVKKSQMSLSGLEVDLTVENGNVVISGTAASQSQLDTVLIAARAVDGVKSVENQATASVQTPSTQPTPVTDVVPASASESTLLLGEPETAGASDSTITSDILGQLGQAKRVGQLRNFDINVSTVDSEVTIRGFVANAQQKDLVLGTAQNSQGVRRVIDEISVTGPRDMQRAVMPAATVSEATPVARPVFAGNPATGASIPRAFAASTINNGPVQVAPVQAAPIQAVPMQAVPMQAVPMQAAPVVPGVVAPQAPVPMNAGPSYGAGVPRHDSPYMPGYAWPSYAAYPNYAAVTYPKQYSASAWPYIGPFHPYPQVPLGWRRVSLEWDDGLWYLDFTHK
jgi:osmotically-inducible protein OsmY